jgi:hypothetical protein
MDASPHGNRFAKSPRSQLQTDQGSKRFFGWPSIGPTTTHCLGQGSGSGQQFDRVLGYLLNPTIDQGQQSFD